MPSTTEKSQIHRIKEIDAELAAAGVAAVNDADAAAGALACANPRTVHRMIERGDLVAFRLGNRFRVRRIELARYIARKER